VDLVDIDNPKFKIYSRRMTPERVLVSKSEQEDAKAKFKAALEKKNQILKVENSGSDTEGSRRIKESSGKTPKMFRRKSG